MDIILKQDVINLGYKNDIVTVKPGYGRNFLIPQGLAILATERNREKAKALEGLKLQIPAKAAATGKIFGSVNTIMIANAIKEATGIEVDRKHIVLNEDAIKEVGDYTAKIKLHKEVAVDINFNVFAE